MQTVSRKGRQTDTQIDKGRQTLATDRQAASHQS